MKCLSVLEEVDADLIRLDGRDLTSNNRFVDLQHRNVAIVFQEFPLFFHINLKSNILYDLKHYDTFEFERMIQVTRHKNVLHRYPHQLSGGEKQRACIVRSILEIVRKYKSTTILVTHDTENLYQYADKVLIVKGATFQQFDNPINTYCNPLICYCARLLVDLNRIVIDNNPYYISPENIRLSKNTNVQITVNQAIFRENKYKIFGKYNNDGIIFYSDHKLKSGAHIYIDFMERDLISFKKGCEGYFEN